MKDNYGKPVHEICVDKTSCRHETTLDKAGGKPGANFEPTGHLTKDAVRKAYEDKETGAKPGRP
ncbi:MAG TPA: hypothetical protein VN521_04985 [Negativicutes bacterium]|nr:hypothetical protein [Negativicutes bacterium]